MTLLIAGVALWWVAHLFKRLLPGMQAKLGSASKGITAGAIVLSVVLMVFGYRMAFGPVYWGRSAALVGINNLLMLAAFYCWSASAAKGAKIWLGTKLRHPQLSAFSIWTVAHLLVNGDLPSFVLFGGLLVWAIVEMIVINAQDGPWQRPARAPFKKEIVAAVVTFVMVTAVMGVHYALGAQPWG